MRKIISVRFLEDAETFIRACPGISGDSPSRGWTPRESSAHFSPEDALLFCWNASPRVGILFFPSRGSGQPGEVLLTLSLSLAFPELWKFYKEQPHHTAKWY